MTAPVVVAEPPAAWVAADVARPPIAESTGASWSSWSASRSPGDEAAMVRACVAAPVPGWVEDMRPALANRTVALAAATAERVTGFPIETADAGAWLALHPVGRTEPVLGATRTFLGFEGDSAFGCFVVCAARRQPNAAAAPCNEVVVRAQLEGGSPPPRPGVALRTVTWAVHNPRPTALAFGAVAVLAGAAAVATRRKPRARS